MTSATSDKTVYPMEDRTSAINSPSTNAYTVLNTIGGSKWATAGQWVEYNFTVESSGMYDIAARFKQDTLDGIYVCRALSIYSHGLNEGDKGFYNGVPFEEANNLKYDYNTKWQVTSLTDGGIDAAGKKTDGATTFYLYFEKNVEYTLHFEVTLGSMGKNVSDVQNALSNINDDYLNIIKLTGASPSSDLDYGFSRAMPDTLNDMLDQATVLLDVADRLSDISGGSSSNVGTLKKVANLLQTMARDEDQIAKKLSTLKTYIGTLGTFVTDVQSQPLQLDYIVIQGKGGEAPRANANFFEAFAFEFGGFFMSFFRDYDSMGADENKDEYDPCALSRYRWLLEEYRLQIFAPELRTFEPVSPKRLDEILPEPVSRGRRG